MRRASPGLPSTAWSPCREEPWRLTGCVPAPRSRSVARVWDEAVLDAIRRDVPAPTTHARNLFHLSAAMWDAWAAYDRTADGYFSREKHRAADVQAARETAISYAAYRILLWRYAQGAGLQTTFDALDCDDDVALPQPRVREQAGDSPAALGNRIAAAVIAAGLADGSLERQHYADPTYRAVNEPLVVAKPGAAMHDPVFWQPLALDQSSRRTAIRIPAAAVVSARGGVTCAVRPTLPAEEGYLDPGSRPVGTARVTRTSGRPSGCSARAATHANDGATIDIRPGAHGNNPLGTNGGTGYSLNPVTGTAVRPERRPAADFARLVTEFWADGPSPRRRRATGTCWRTRSRPPRLAGGSAPARVARSSGT